nr:unnamed protein product [Spirometra erinaceieuropaei]
MDCPADGPRRRRWLRRVRASWLVKQKIPSRQVQAPAEVADAWVSDGLSGGWTSPTTLAQAGAGILVGQARDTFASGSSTSRGGRRMGVGWTVRRRALTCFLSAGFSLPQLKPAHHISSTLGSASVTLTD